MIESTVMLTQSNALKKRVLRMITCFIALTFSLVGNALELDHLKGNPYLKPECIIWSTATNGQHVWFGTSNGLVELDKNNNSWRSYKDKTRIKDVHSLCWDGRRLLVGTFEAGQCELLSYNPTSGEWLSLLTGPAVGEHEIWSILVENNALWLGVSNGVLHQDFKTGKWTSFVFGHRALSLAQYKGVLYIGTEKGLWALSDGNPPKAVSAAELEKSLVYAVLPLENGMWLGTSSGAFFSSSLDTVEWKCFNTGNSGICCTSIYSIKNDGAYIWFAGTGGVSRFDSARGKWFSYTPAGGLFWNQGTVTAFCNDGKLFWFSTACGGAFSIKRMDHYPEFIDNWFFIGPFGFDNTEKGFQEVLLTETIQPEKLIETMKGEIAQKNWFKVQQQSFDSSVDLRKVFDVERNSICYAYTQINSGNEKNIQIGIDCNDAIKVWINQNAVINSYREYVSGISLNSEKKANVKLRKGRNDVLIKIANHKSDGRIWGFYFRIIVPSEQ